MLDASSDSGQTTTQITYCIGFFYRFWNYSGMVKAAACILLLIFGPHVWCVFNSRGMESLSVLLHLHHKRELKGVVEECSYELLIWGRKSVGRKSISGCVYSMHHGIDGRAASGHVEGVNGHVRLPKHFLLLTRVKRISLPDT